MAKQRKTAAAPAAPSLATELAAVAAPAEKPAAPAAKSTDLMLVMGKRYRVKTNTKHTHDQHWDAICKALVNGPQSFSALVALGTPVHSTNATPYVRYCVRRGWLVQLQA
jgi:hypothetical protein